MRPFKGFFWIWFVIELLVFFLVAKWLGVLVAILLIILPMIVGGSIMQMQGMTVYRQMQQKIARGESPAVEVLESAAIVFGGILMLIPGIVTTLIGIVLLIPGLRRPLLQWLIRRGAIPAHVQKANHTSGSGRIYDAEVDRDD